MDKVHIARVDFYVLKTRGRDVFGRTACRLAERAWKAKYQVLVRTDSLQSAEWFDELLWTFRQDSFVPHAIAREGIRTSSDKVEIDREPVMISIRSTDPITADVLINLNHNAPLDHAQYPRVVEIVTGDEEAREQGRERFRYYRGARLRSSYSRYVN